LEFLFKQLFMCFLIGLLSIVLIVFSFQEGVDLRNG
jgi:hypothetical protein